MTLPGPSAFPRTLRCAAYVSIQAVSWEDSGETRSAIGCLALAAMTLIYITLSFSQLQIDVLDTCIMTLVASGCLSRSWGFLVRTKVSTAVQRSQACHTLWLPETPNGGHGLQVILALCWNWIQWALRVASPTGVKERLSALAHSQQLCGLQELELALLPVGMQAASHISASTRQPVV